ncbi:MAG: cyclic pyranopterin monophosphate synthase MoaC [Bacteroidota bacterium]
MPDSDAPTLGHVDGRAHMADLSLRSASARTAVASGRVLLGEASFSQVQEGTVKKGDVLSVAQIAGILGAKRTSQLIPLCHDVLLQNVDLDLDLDEERRSVEIRALTKAQGPTGVEMEALTAVSVAALTVYDMCKSIDREIRITDIGLLAKTGGQSGAYRRSN